jgi:hypothetical protein
MEAAMRAWRMVGVLLIVLSVGAPVDMFACGDKFLIAGRFRRDQRPKNARAANFAIVEKAVEDLRGNRSHLSMNFGYALTRSLYVHGGALFQRTHDGITTAEVTSGVVPPNQFAQAIAFSRCGTGT